MHSAGAPARATSVGRWSEPAFPTGVLNHITSEVVDWVWLAAADDEVASIPPRTRTKEQQSAGATTLIKQLFIASKKTPATLGADGRACPG